MDFSALGATISLPQALWIVWGIMLVVWVVLSAILMYHWQSYGTDDPRIRTMRLIYFILSTLLFASATTFIFSL